jgi:hypothetical protein
VVVGQAHCAKRAPIRAKPLYTHNRRHLGEGFMDLGFITDRARYNLLNAGERSYLRKTDTAVGEEAAEDPRNGGGPS